MGYFPIKSTYLITENETSLSSVNDFFAHYTLRHLYFNQSEKEDWPTSTYSGGSQLSSLTFLGDGIDDL